MNVNVKEEVRVSRGFFARWIYCGLVLKYRNVYRGRDAASEHSRSHREHKEAERVEEPQPSEQNETEGMLELEKLFNKTKSSPQIFWKPLTDEEVEVY